VEQHETPGLQQVSPQFSQDDERALEVCAYSISMHGPG